LHVAKEPGEIGKFWVTEKASGEAGGGGKKKKVNNVGLGRMTLGFEGGFCVKKRGGVKLLLGGGGETEGGKKRGGWKANTTLQLTKNQLDDQGKNGGPDNRLCQGREGRSEKIGKDREKNNRWRIALTKP